MWDWLPRLFTRGYSGLTDLAGDIRKAITDAINTLIAQFVSWVVAGMNLFNASINLAVGFVAMLVSLINFSKRLALVYLPNLLESAVAQAFAWTEERYHEVVSFAQTIVQQAIDLARQLYADVRSWALDQVTAIWNYLSQLVTVLNDVARRVYALLTSPRALADWVAGEIIGALWRWGVGNAAALTRIAFAGAVSGALKLAGLLEQVIADVFL